MQAIRDKLRQFFSDPLGTSIEFAVYLLMLGIGIFVLILFARMAWNMVASAAR